jgi:hypothetical protein
MRARSYLKTHQNGSIFSDLLTYAAISLMRLMIVLERGRVDGEGVFVSAHGDFKILLPTVFEEFRGVFGNAEILEIFEGIFGDLIGGGFLFLGKAEEEEIFKLLFRLFGAEGASLIERAAHVVADRTRDQRDEEDHDHDF